MLLSAEHLSINFGSRQLLEDVNFYLNEGQGRRHRHQRHRQVHLFEGSGREIRG